MFNKDSECNYQLEYWSSQGARGKRQSTKGITQALSGVQEDEGWPSHVLTWNNDLIMPPNAPQKGAAMERSAGKRTAVPSTELHVYVLLCLREVRSSTGFATEHFFPNAGP